jgi:hypothetical protein
MTRGQKTSASSLDTKVGTSTRPQEAPGESLKAHGAVLEGRQLSSTVKGKGLVIAAVIKTMWA